MFFPGAHVRVWLYNRPTDMRKSYDGLSALVKTVLQEDPASGHLFVFVNRKRTHKQSVTIPRDEYDTFQAQMKSLQTQLDWFKRQLFWREVGEAPATRLGDSARLAQTPWRVLA